MKYIKLENIASVGSGQNAPQAQDDYVTNGYTFIKASNLDDIIADDNEGRACKITNEAVKTNALKVVEPNSILFAKSGLSCVKNRVYLTKDESYVVNHLCIVSNISNSFNPKWLSYFIKSYNVTKLIKDESYPSISLKDIKNIDVPMISMYEQEKVVLVIEKIEMAIKNKKKQLFSLDELIKSRFIEMFGDVFNGQSNYPTIKISEVVASKIERASKDFQSDDEIQYVDISSIDNSKNQIIGYTKYLKKNAPSRAQQHVKKNDIVISTVRPNLNNVARIAHEYDNIVASSGFCVLRAEKIEPDYLFGLVSMHAFADYLSSLTTGASYPAVSDKDILNFEIPNAPKDKQMEYARFIQLVDKSKFVVHSRYFL